ncbi:MAG: CoA ester lyase [Chloroflexota bacterium]
MSTFRLRRTLLFLPGNNPRFLQRALESEADGLILDIEDAVAPEHKLQAREMVREALRTADFGRKERVVRVNNVTSPQGAGDIDAVVAGGADLILVPKADSPAVLQTAEHLVTAAERRHGAPEGRTQLGALIETAIGLINVDQTAFATPRLAVLCFGAGDFGLSTGIKPGPDEAEYLYPESRIMVAARAAGAMALGTPWVENIADIEGARRSAQRERRLGLVGKCLIHPTHVQVVNEAFTPSGEEIAYAQKVVTAYESAGRGAIQVDGKLIEHLHVAQMRQVLDIARLAGKLSAGA